MSTIGDRRIVERRGNCPPRQQRWPEELDRSGNGPYRREPTTPEALGYLLRSLLDGERGPKRRNLLGQRHGR